jgi:hypothetical protein
MFELNESFQGFLIFAYDVDYFPATATVDGTGA